jgi:hypothetical protein
VITEPCRRILRPAGARVKGGRVYPGFRLRLHPGLYPPRPCRGSDAEVHVADDVSRQVDLLNEAICCHAAGVTSEAVLGKSDPSLLRVPPRVPRLCVEVFSNYGRDARSPLLVSLLNPCNRRNRRTTIFVWLRPCRDGLIWNRSSGRRNGPRYPLPPNFICVHLRHLRTNSFFGSGSAALQTPRFRDHVN